MSQPDSDTFTSPSGDFAFTVSRLGAELVSIRRRGGDGGWLGFLHRDGLLDKPQRGWGNHATVMGYFIHRLVEQSTLYRGQPLRGGTHSFLRHKEFGAPRELGDGFAYALGKRQIDDAEYPLDVALELRYRALADGKLGVEFEFSNNERGLEAHLSYGLHPGFAVAALAQCRIALPAGRYRRHLAPGNFLSGETLEIEHAGGPAPFPLDRLPDSYLVEFVEVASHRIELSDPAGGRRVVVDTGDAPYFTLWSDGGPFVCIEPCWGLPDHHDQRPFERKLGIQRIPPAGVITAGCSIECLPAARA